MTQKGKAAVGVYLHLTKLLGGLVIDGQRLVVCAPVRAQIFLATWPSADFPQPGGASGPLQVAGLRAFRVAGFDWNMHPVHPGVIERASDTDSAPFPGRSR